MNYFDFEAVAREGGIGQEDLSQITQAIRAEFPTDDMMWELHVLRACMAIRDGRITVQDVLHREAA